MNDTKFTPGPWRFEVDGDTNYAKIFCSSNPHDGDNLRGYCGKHNANLIAAAPELFDCLQRCLDEMVWIGPKAKKTAEDSHAALAKARGEA